MNPDSPIWRSFHSLFFLIGGCTFIIATAVLYYPEVVDFDTISAWFFTIGSVGLLAVDSMEFFTFTDDMWLRVNIFTSLTGSMLYLLGSIGFFPEVYMRTDLLGVWGLILGSFFIGASEIWKIYRIGRSRTSSASFARRSVYTAPVNRASMGPPVDNNRTLFVPSPPTTASLSSSSIPSYTSVFEFRNLFADQMQITAFGVEASALLGAVCFFIGTIIFYADPLDADLYKHVLDLWALGSTGFTLAAVNCEASANKFLI